jgi:hypothetical protein
MSNETFSLAEMKVIMKGCIDAAGERGVDGDELDRCAQWAHTAALETAMLNLVLIGSVGVTWPEGSEEPVFVSLRPYREPEVWEQ